MKLYHLVPSVEWHAAAQSGEYRPASLETDGFIHLSTSAQWIGAANRFYRGRTDLLLLEVDGARLHADVRFEAADGDRFPHLYGPMEPAAARIVCALAPDAAGMFHAPHELAARQP